MHDVSGRRRPLLRPRLFDALDDGVSGCPLTLVSAPPGSGKTVLISTWLSERPPDGSVLWLPLREGEHTSLWGPVLAAVGTATDPSGPGDATAGDFVDRLRKAIVKRDEPLVLVVDDLHNASAPALAALQRLLQDPPAPLRVVAASRIDPPLSLHVLRVTGDLAELRASDLAFQEEEARELFETSGLDVSEAELTAVLAQTEGWVAGLRLLALSLTGRPDRGAAIERLTLDERPVSEYLAAEALAWQPPDVRDFLLRTSIVATLDAELADALTGRSDSARLLEQLCHDNVFLSRLEGDRRFYRFHQLFRALLLAEARCELGGDVGALHERAAVLLAARGRPIEAIGHAVEAERWDLVAALLAEHWAGALTETDSVSRALVSAVPGGYAKASPVLGAFSALARLVDGEYGQAAALLSDAKKRRQRVPAPMRLQFDGMTRYGSALLARGRGNLRGAAELAAVQIEQAAVESGSAADEDRHRALGLVTLGIGQLWSGSDDDARASLEEAIALARSSDTAVAEADALAHLALLELGHGHTRRATRLAGAALDLDGAGGMPERPAALAAHAVTASAHHSWGDDEAARASLAAADRIARRTGDAPGRVLVALVSAQLAASAGGDEADSALLQLRAVQARNPAARCTLAQAPLSALEVRLLAASGRADLAGEAGAELNGEPLAAVATARLRLSAAQPGEALDALHGRSVPPPVEIEALVLEALAHRALGADEDAQLRIADALALAEPEFARRPFLDGGGAVRELLAQHLRVTNAQRWFASELIAALDGRSANDGAPADLLEPLSEREREVLRYLPTVMSNADIAAELFVSVNTVKTHVKSIYRKLGATRRQDAVRRARQLRLL